MPSKQKNKNMDDFVKSKIPNISEEDKILAKEQLEELLEVITSIFLRKLQDR